MLSCQPHSTGQRGLDQVWKQKNKQQIRNPNLQTPFDGDNLKKRSDCPALAHAWLSFLSADTFDR